MKGRGQDTGSWGHEEMRGQPGGQLRPGSQEWQRAETAVVDFRGGVDRTQ